MAKVKLTGKGKAAHGRKEAIDSLKAAPEKGNNLALIIDEMNTAQDGAETGYRHLILYCAGKRFPDVTTFTRDLLAGENAWLESAYNKAQLACQNEAELKDVERLFKWTKDTKGRAKGDWKVTQLPMLYRSAKSTIAKVFEYNASPEVQAGEKPPVALINPETEEPMGKAALAKAIKPESSELQKAQGTLKTLSGQCGKLSTKKDLLIIVEGLLSLVNPLQARVKDFEEKEKAAVAATKKTTRKPAAHRPAEVTA